MSKKKHKYNNKKINKKKKKKKFNKQKKYVKQNINKNLSTKNSNNNKKTNNQTKKENNLNKNNKDNKKINNLSKKHISNIEKSKKHNPLLITTSIILSILLILIIIIFIINKNTKITLIGNDKETIEAFSQYNDPGINATLFKKNIKNKVKTISNLNTNKLGTYIITYKISLLTNKKVIREVKVIDTIKPTITLNGNNTINIYINDKYEDEGVKIEDNYDTDLSQNLNIESNLDTSKKGTYTITYTVHDSSNNTSSITRTINVKEKIIVTNNSNNKSCNISNPIEKYICDNDYNISIGYYNLTNNKSYYYKNYKLYYGASLIKTLDALYLYDKNLINDSLKEHVKKVITVSDNESHHYLVNYIGKDNLKQYGISIGASNTLYGTDNFGYTSVNDQIAYMKKLYNITKDNKQEELKSFFKNTRKNYLLFDGSPTIMHKYGHWEHVYHNAGIVLDDNPYIVVILTNEGYDNYQNIIKTLSKLIYEYHNTN